MTLSVSEPAATQCRWPPFNSTKRLRLFACRRVFRNHRSTAPLPAFRSHRTWQNAPQRSPVDGACRHRKPGFVASPRPHRCIPGNARSHPRDRRFASGARDDDNAVVPRIALLLNRWGWPPCLPAAPRMLRSAQNATPRRFAIVGSRCVGSMLRVVRALVSDG